MSDLQISKTSAGQGRSPVRSAAMTKRNQSDLGFIDDRWTNRDGTPSTRHGVGKRYRARWNDEDGVQRSASFASEKAAKAHLRLVARGEYANTTGKLTFKQYFDLWSPGQVWAPGTVKKVDQAINSVTFADVPLERLRPTVIQAWIKTLVDKGLAANTIRSRHDHVRAVIRAAVADRAIPFDVTSNTTLPRARRRESAMVIPTTAQVGAAVAKSPEGFAGFVALCAFGGLRLGEAGGLQVGDIDFMRREVHIQRQAKRVDGGGFEIRPPKNGSERTVYIPEDLAKMLAEHVRLHVSDGDSERWMFADATGDPLHENSAGYLWSKTRDAAKVAYKLHDLRHFYASGLIAAGCDVVTVQRAMGHASASLTLNTYSHLWPKAEDRTRKAAAEMLSEALTVVPVWSKTQ